MRRSDDPHRYEWVGADEREQAIIPPFSPVFAERGRNGPPPATRVDHHTTKRGVSVCPHFLASISRCRLFSQDQELL